MKSRKAHLNHENGMISIDTDFDSIRFLIWFLRRVYALRRCVRLEPEKFGKNNQIHDTALGCILPGSIGYTNTLTTI